VGQGGGRFQGGVGHPVARLSKEADEVACLATPEPFFAVGQWYERFAQTSDQEVVELLQRAAG
jgi:putative phosphoribosyl transferase